MKNQQELIDEYLYYCLKQRKLDEKTVRAYRIDLRQFSEFCVQKKLVTEKAIIRQYILHLHESYKQKTVKRKVASIKAFYSYLEDEEIIDDSPLRKIRTEFREEKILPRSIPVENKVSTTAISRFSNFFSDIVLSMLFLLHG